MFNTCTQNVIVLTYPEGYSWVPFLGEGAAALLLPVLDLVLEMLIVRLLGPVNHTLTQPCVHLSRAFIQSFKISLFGSAKNPQSLAVTIVFDVLIWVCVLSTRVLVLALFACPTCTYRSIYLTHYPLFAVLFPCLRQVQGRVHASPIYRDHLHWNVQRLSVAPLPRAEEGAGHRYGLCLQVLRALRMGYRLRTEAPVVEQGTERLQVGPAYQLLPGDSMVSFRVTV